MLFPTTGAAGDDGEDADAGEDSAGVESSIEEEASTVQPEGCLDEVTPQDWRISRDTRAPADIMI